MSGALTNMALGAKQAAVLRFMQGARERLRYGADPTGSNDSSPAFDAACRSGAGVVTDTVADCAALPPLPLQVSV